MDRAYSIESNRNIHFYLQIVFWLVPRIDVLIWPIIRSFKEDWINIAWNPSQFISQIHILSLEKWILFGKSGLSSYLVILFFQSSREARRAQLA